MIQQLIAKAVNNKSGMFHPTFSLGQLGDKVRVQFLFVLDLSAIQRDIENLN